MKESTRIKEQIKQLESEYKEALVKEGIQDKVDLRTFIETVASDVFEETIEDIKSKKRDRELLQPRSLCYYAYRRHTNDSLGKIGLAFNRTHATIINSLDKVEVDMMTSPLYRGRMNKGLNIIREFVELRDLDV